MEVGDRGALRSEVGTEVGTEVDDRGASEPQVGAPDHAPRPPNIHLSIKRR